MLYDIPGYEGLYQITEYGMVFGVKRQKFLKVRIDKDGYIGFVLWREGKPTPKRAHRLVALVFHGEPVGGANLALHNDGSRDNNHKSNIRWGTPQENMDDKEKHGRNHWSNKAECVWGHPYEPDNVYIDPGKGSRSCLLCRKRSADKQKEKRRTK